MEEIEELEGGARLARLVRKQKGDDATTHDHGFDESEEREAQIVPLLTGTT